MTAPVEWLGLNLDPRDEIVEHHPPHTYVHFSDGLLRIEECAPPEAYVDCLRPASTRSPTLGALILRGLLGQANLLAHAAALNLDGRTLLVVGPSGAGKSTLAAAWIRCHRTILTDDAAVLVAPEKGATTWWIEPWRTDLALLPDAAERLFDPATDQNAAKIHRTEGDKAEKVWIRHVDHPDAFEGEAPLRGMLFLTSPHPCRSRESRLTGITQAEAFARFLTLHPTLTGAGRVASRARASATRLVSQVPVAMLEVGSDLLTTTLDEVERIEDLVSTSAAFG